MRIHRILIWTAAFAAAGLGLVLGGREMLSASVASPFQGGAAQTALTVLYVAEWPTCLAWTLWLTGPFDPVAPGVMALGVAGWALVGLMLGLLGAAHGRGVKALLPPKFFAIVFAALPAWIYIIPVFLGNRAVPDLSIFVAVNVSLVLALLLFTLTGALVRYRRLPPERRLPIRF